MLLSCEYNPKTNTDLSHVVTFCQKFGEDGYGSAISGPCVCACVCACL